MSTVFGYKVITVYEGSQVDSEETALSENVWNNETDCDIAMQKEAESIARDCEGEGVGGYNEWFVKARRFNVTIKKISFVLK